MNLIRTAGRMMLASYFVYNGAKQAINPKPLVADAEPVADRLVPLAKKVAPAPVAGFIPNDTTTLVRLNGAGLALGGVALGTGLARRPGALLAAASMLPHVLAVNPNGGANGLEKDENRHHFVRNLALLGSALVASQDLQGRPSLGWRANDQLSRFGRKTDKKVGELTSGVEDMSKSAQKKFAKAQKDAEKQARKVAKKAKKDGVGSAVAELLH